MLKCPRICPNMKPPLWLAKGVIDDVCGQPKSRAVARRGPTGKIILGHSFSYIEALNVKLN
jgi:hypothetical protein